MTARQGTQVEQMCNRKKTTWWKPRGQIFLKLKIKNNFYIYKQPLMRAYEGSESARDNFGKIHQLTSTETQKTCQETWKDPNKIIETKSIIVI